MLLDRAASCGKSPITDFCLDQDEIEPPCDTPDAADSAKAPPPSDEGQVNAGEAQAAEPTTTDSGPPPAESGNSESPDAALDVPGWAADQLEPKEANFPPIEPVVGDEVDAGNNEPVSADTPTVSFPSCAVHPSLLLSLSQVLSSQSKLLLDHQEHPIISGHTQLVNSTIDRVLCIER